MTPARAAPATVKSPVNVTFAGNAKQKKTSSAAPLPSLKTRTVDVSVSPTNVEAWSTSCSLDRNGDATSSASPTAPITKSSPSTPGAPPEVTRMLVADWLFLRTSGL